MNGLYRTGENLLESIELALNFRKNRKKTTNFHLGRREKLLNSRLLIANNIHLEEATGRLKHQCLRKDLHYHL